MNHGKKSPERRISDRTAQEAGYWDARLRSPDCSQADRARFLEWRTADPEHSVAFERAQAIVASLRHNSARADVRAISDAALGATKSPNWVGRWPYVMAAACAATLAIAMYWSAGRMGLEHPSLTGWIARAERWIGTRSGAVYETSAGQRSTLTLQDGSLVDLNARTRIKVAFDQNTRQVELLSGQAIFHVIHNSQRPFIVHVADKDITVVGTEFDVRLDATSMRVTLIEGKVRVTRQSAVAEAGGREFSNSHEATDVRRVGAQTANTHNLQDPGASIYLSPGQQLITRLRSARQGNTDDNPESGAAAVTSTVTTEPDGVIRTIDVAKVTAWRDGRVFLEDLTLADAVAEMNRHSPVQIVISDPQLAALRINGMFRAGEQEEFVNALEHYFPISARHPSDLEIQLVGRR